MIYDSLLDSEPHSHTFYAVAQICPEKNDELKLLLMKTQHQKDGVSCGLFAIANATALAFGLNPSELVYDQSDLRSHFILCCLNKKIQPFPFIQSRKCRNWRPSSYLKCPLYCKCKMPFSENDVGFPDRFRTIVECKGCQNWYHLNCEKNLMIWLIELTNVANGAVLLVCWPEVVKNICLSLISPLWGCTNFNLKYKNSS